jgi:hypothetical protein
MSRCVIPKDFVRRLLTSIVQSWLAAALALIGRHAELQLHHLIG